MQFKNEQDREMFTLLHPALIMIFSDLYWYAKAYHDVDLVITQTISTPEQDAKLKRVSKAHGRGLAIDIRTKDLDAFVIDDLQNYVNNKFAYEQYRYLSHSGAYRLAYYHNNSNGEHFHLAIHSKFKNYKAVNTLQ